MNQKDLLIRIYHKDTGQMIHPNQISAVNPNRRRLSTTNPKAKGDVLFDKVVIMRCTGLLAAQRGIAGETDQLIYEFDEVTVEEKGKPVRGRIIYLPATASFGIQIGIKTVPLDREVTITSTDQDIINYLEGAEYAKR